MFVADPPTGSSDFGFILFRQPISGSLRTLVNEVIKLRIVITSNSNF